MSRRLREDQPFGSDSFLDVIANIVGILIILIVIVGMKVANQVAAPPGDDTATTAAAAAPGPDPDAIAAAAALKRRIANQESELENAEAALDRAMQVHMKALEESERIAASADELSGDEEQLNTRLQDLSKQQESHEQKALMNQLSMARVDAESEQLTKKRTRIATQLTSLDNKHVHTDLQLARVSQEMSEIEGVAQLVAAETQRLQETLQETLETPTGPVDRLRHRLAPVSAFASDDEVHFRLSEGKISHIPVDELIERLKSQVKSRSATIQRFARYDGTVGPIEGYHMSYVVQREGLSSLQAMQYGARGYRVSVSRWTITPSSEIQAEVPQAAVRPGSRFRRIVETLRPGSTVTIWVYPDSFAAFPPIREVAHALQLKVAARPLPEGMPIVGSPAGSQSRAQ